jgi:hypothetical protein
MSYTPLDSDFLTSTLLQEGPDVVSVWALVLASADKLGESGMQPTVAASLLRISVERADAAFAVLTQPDPRSRNREYEGRRLVPTDDGGWFIVSHQKYQKRASRANATKRNARYEARKKGLDQLTAVSAGKCDHAGCYGPGEHAAGGRMVCTAHAFDVSAREPGHEG